GRWGEKVPATVGTVADGFALLHSCALHLEGAWLAADDTGASAVGTGLVLTQGIGLLFQKGLQGALGEAGGSGTGELLHGVQVDVEPGSVVAESTAGDDFAPLGSEALELLELFGSEGAACHAASCLKVESTTRGKRARSRYDPQLHKAKRFMTSHAVCSSGEPVAPRRVSTTIRGSSAEDDHGANAFRPQPDGLPAHRRRQDGAVQLAVREKTWRPVPPAH